MPYVRCKVAEGLRPSEVTVEIVGRGGRSEFLRVDRAFVKTIKSQDHLPIGLVYKDRVEDKDIALIELPHEADSGANRMWVESSAVLDDPPVPVEAAHDFK